MKKNRLRDKLWSLVPLAQIYLIVTAVLILLLIDIGIILLAPKLGWFFVPTLLLYNAVLLAVGYRVMYRRKMDNIRAIAGDEAFFSLYPKEAKRVARERARNERLLNKELERKKKREEKQRERNNRWL